MHVARRLEYRSGERRRRGGEDGALHRHAGEQRVPARLRDGDGGDGDDRDNVSLDVVYPAQAQITTKWGSS